VILRKDSKYIITAGVFLFFALLCFSITHWGLGVQF
jgi:hypothetical protein